MLALTLANKSILSGNILSCILIRDKIVDFRDAFQIVSNFNGILCFNKNRIYLIFFACIRYSIQKINRAQHDMTDYEWPFLIRINSKCKKLYGVWIII